MLLSPKNVAGFVRAYFAGKTKYLRALERACSPLYIIEPDVLAARARQFAQTFRKHIRECRFYFAVKSNHHPLVARTVLKEGFGLDVSSGRELELALELGAADILFTGPGKTDLELRLAVEHADRLTLMLDSPGELHKVEKIAAASRTIVKAGVRLCPQPDGLWRKFGIPLAGLPGFCEESETCPHVHVQGLQFHTSWNLTPQAQTDFIGVLARKLSGCPPAFLRKIRFLDVGGGYWPPPGTWARSARKSGRTVAFRPSASLEAFARGISRAIAGLDFMPSCAVFLEPGRWICNDGMHLLMTVVDKKAADLAIVDAGINAIGWERFTTEYFPILNFSRPSFEEKACSICGSLCTPDDVFGYSYFGKDVLIGDVLFMPCQGAYTYSLRQNFIKPPPEVAVVSAGRRAVKLL